MDEELGTDPELLWPLLLVQIVYDCLGRGEVSYSEVSEMYRKHPLLPDNAPVIGSASEAKQVYSELLRDNGVGENPDGGRAQAQALAEKLYVQFHANLSEKIADDANEFIATYRRLEREAEVPKEERIADE